MIIEMEERRTWRDWFHRTQGNQEIAVLSVTERPSRVGTEKKNFFLKKEAPLFYYTGSGGSDACLGVVGRVIIWV